MNFNLTIQKNEKKSHWSLSLFETIGKDSNGNCTLVLHEDLVTQGNKYKLYQKHLGFDLRKYFFYNRIITICNNLPNYVVSSISIPMSENTVNKFVYMLRVYFSTES